MTVTRNANFANLSAGYLFPEVAKRRREYQAAYPDKKVISLGIGNTTEPLPRHITDALVKYAKGLGTPAGYSGYGDETGNTDLRQKIASVLYGGTTVSPDEVFISDGAKCDIARLQLLFGPAAKVAVQDPAYPVYVDGSVLIGAGGAPCATPEFAGANSQQVSDAGYTGITYLPCTAENGFFPPLKAVTPGSLLYFCSPNNPTGAVATRPQLIALVDFCLTRGCMLIFDAAYYAFIRDPALPKTIYEIPGAERCSIEVNSFSKLAGFTGVRLGWTVVPKALTFADGTLVIKDWTRVMTTLFNGASNIAQAGGIASLDEIGQKETASLVDYYLANQKVMMTALEGPNFAAAGVKVYGAGNSPYLWVQFPGHKSWDIFDRILNECSVVTTPGSGFGPAGESYLRFSSFGHRKDVEEAARRLAGFRV